MYMLRDGEIRLLILLSYVIIHKNCMIKSTIVQYLDMDKCKQKKTIVAQTWIDNINGLKPAILYLFWMLVDWVLKKTPDAE